MNKKYLIVKDTVIREGQFENNQEIEEVVLPNATKLEVAAFKNCHSLRRVVFGFEVDNFVIEDGAFDCCNDLTDIDFMIKAKNPTIKISEEAFRTTCRKITFHVPVHIHYKYLEEYAKKHNYKVKEHL